MKLHAIELVIIVGYFAGGISVMAAMTLADTGLNMVCPLIGSSRGNLFGAVDPRLPADLEVGRKLYFLKVDFYSTLKITQGIKKRCYLQPASAAGENDSKFLHSRKTAAVNLRAANGPVMAIELLQAPCADHAGLPEQPKVLAHWPWETCLHKYHDVTFFHL